MKIDKLPSINGLRALSICLVILYHLSMKFGVFYYFETYTWLKPITNLLQDGHLGVNVFFVISGFLITTLLLNEEANTKTISVKNFFIRRTLRIFPAYYFMLLVYFILQLLGYMQISNSSWFTALTYTKYFNWNLDWVTSHGWSLSIEEHFYLFWPFVFLGGELFRKRITIFIILLVPFIRIFSHYYPIDWINELTFFERIDAIAIGCLFALYKNEILNVLGKHLRWLFYTSLVLLVIIPYVPELTKVLHLDIIIIGFIGTDKTLGNLLIALILIHSVFGGQTLWYNFLNLKWMNYIGMLSYSIYLWQQFFIYESPYWYNQYPFNLIYIAVAALLSYYLIEKPFLKLKTKF